MACHGLELLDRVLTYGLRVQEAAAEAGLTSNQARRRILMYLVAVRTLDSLGRVPATRTKKDRSKAALPPAPRDENRYTVNEVAKILRRSRRYVEGLMGGKKSGSVQLRPIREGRNVWILREELERYQGTLRARSGLPRRS